MKQIKADNYKIILWRSFTKIKYYNYFPFMSSGSSVTYLNYDFFTSSQFLRKSNYVKRSLCILLNFY